MVAEAWFLKMGNQVSSNLKQALFLDPSSNKKKSNTTKKQQTIGILSFEVANVMSKVIHLHKSLTDNEITRLKTEILKSEGVVNVVSDDESYLVELVIAEKLDDLNRIVGVVARLGKKCAEPALHGFEHVFGDIMCGLIDVKELGFLVKNMEGMIRKMERYVNSTSNLYNESQVLNELEQTSKKFQQNQHEESRRVFEQKLTWHKQDVRHLKDVSLWNQTYDKIVGLLARAICTIFARLCTLFGDSVVLVESSGLSSEFYSAVGSSFVQNRSGLLSGPIDVRRNRQMASGPLQQSASSRSSAYNSGPIARAPAERKGTPARPGMTPQRSTVPSFRPEDVSFPCGASPGRLFTDCLRLSSSASLTLDDDSKHEGQDNQTFGCCTAANGSRREQHYPSDCSNMVEMSVPFTGDQRKSGTVCGITSTGKSPFRPKSRLMVYASASTVGGSALALHYANVIIVIEKLLRYPHLVGDEARDDLYQMLPTSLRMSLRTNLKSYAKNLSIYDAPLAHEWKETLEKKLRWLAPLAHTMIRWQTERNLEQQQIIASTNVLLLQTLYFADREKTEAAICELLVGLNYICRYEHQQNALLDCASSFNFDDCVEWRWQDPYL